MLRVTPEGKIKKIVSKGLKVLQEQYPGNIFVRMPVLRGMGSPWLDYVICANGWYVMIETKRDKDHDLTEIQKDTAYEACVAGALVFKVYDQYTADQALREIERQCLKS
jgi:hypothetical protein